MGQTKINKNIFMKNMNKKTWKDLTLRQGQELVLLDCEDEWDLVLNQMSIILDTTIDEIESKPVALVYEFMADWDFIKVLPEKRELKHFKNERQWYKMIDLNKITLAQMIDIEEYYSDGLIKNLHKILSVLYLPASKNIFGSWTIEEYIPDEKRENIFLDMDMESVFGAAIFFWIGAELYLRGLKVSLLGETMKKRVKKEEV